MLNSLARVARATVLLLAVALPTSSAADSTEATAAKIVAAWEDWVAGQGIRSARIAVAYRGRLVGAAGVGGDANAVFPIASLSKAVTAACVARLADQGRLSLSDTLRDFADLPASADVLAGPVGEISVADLLAHSSGLKPDPTQQQMRGWLNQARPRHTEAARAALAQRYSASRKGRHFYNNANYAILGAILEMVSGKSYAQTCGREVLARAGVKPRLSARYGAQGAWGGWAMTAPELLKLVEASFGPSTRIGRNPGAWARASIGGGAFYGMGTLFRTAGSGSNFWHFGAHCYGGAGEAGAFFARWNSGWSVATGYADCVSDSAMSKLDDALWRAAHK